MLRLFRNLLRPVEPTNQELLVAILASTQAVSKPSRSIHLRHLSGVARSTPKNEARMKLQRILEKA